jgi:hypothetical protein
MPGGNVSARTEHSDPPRARRIPAGTKASERRPVADAALRLANPHQLFNSQSREREREFLGLELPAAPQDGSNDKAQGASGSVRRRAWRVSEWVTRARSVRRPWPGRPWRGSAACPCLAARRADVGRDGVDGANRNRRLAGCLLWPLATVIHCAHVTWLCGPAMPRCSTRCAGAQLFSNSNRSFPQTERQATATCVRARGSGLAGPTTCHRWAPTQAGPRPSWITRVSPKHNRPKIEVRHH